MLKKIIYQVQCKRCSSQWFPRVAKPKRCPFCKRLHWDKPPIYKPRRKSVASG